MNLRVTPTNITVTVEWDPPIDANGLISSYQVDLFDNSNIEINTARVDSLTALEHTFGGLMPYTDYSVEVRAVTGDMNNILGQMARDSFMTEIGSKYLSISFCLSLPPSLFPFHFYE